MRWERVLDACEVAYVATALILLTIVAIVSVL